MRVDPNVCREKFGKEVQRLRSHEASLRKWGCWIQRTDFPEIDAVFLPHAALHVQILQPRFSGLVLAPSGLPPIDLVTKEFPQLSARPFGVRMLLDDFDILAPSLTFRDPWTWQTLTSSHMPTGNLPSDNGRQANRVILDQHPLTKSTFLCVRGTREYHEHPQHTGDEWMLIRDNFAIYDLIALIWRTCTQHALPLLRPQGIVAWEWKR